MRSSRCMHSPHDNTYNHIHPLLLIVVFHILSFIIIAMQLFISALVNWSRSGVSLLQGGFSTLLFYLVHMYEKARGKKTTLPALTHLTARHWDTGRGERIFYLTLSLSVKTSGRLRLLWHTWWSAALHMIMTALDLLRSMCYIETKLSWY